MIYDAIKTIADQRGVSIRKLESDLGYSNGTISKWNTSDPKILKLQAVTKYLKVDLNTLLLLANGDEVHE